MNGHIFHIERTLEEVCRAIDRAEANMRKHVRTYYHNVNEEFITGLFYGHIKYYLSKASEKRLIEDAFLQDLKKICNANIPGGILESKLHDHSAGLIADIILHNRHEEGKTGGDFGLVIVHPQIQLNRTSLEIKKGISSGLLCQAKLKSKDGKWGSFTENQKKALLDHLEFTSLVLYSYADGDRTKLNPITWKSCRGQTFQDIENLLKSDFLRELASTTEILTRLGQKQIGTQDQTLIETVISPSIRQGLEIKIYWKEDDDPKGRVEVKISTQQRQKQTVYLKLGRT